MIVKDLVQGTNAWRCYRADHVMATDASIIMGTNPYKTPLKLWKQKLSLIEEDPINPAMQRGSDLEPKARRAFEEMTDLKMEAVVMEHDTYKWMAASLDGYDGKHLLEIKCPMSRVFGECKDGNIPAYWLTQIQHQLAVTGLDWAYLWVFDGEEGFITEIERDRLSIALMVKKEEEFYRRLVEFDPPEDKYRRRDDMDWRKQANRLGLAKIEYERAKKAFETEKELLLLLAGDESVEGGGVRVNRYYSRGLVNYKNIPELKGVDLDRYRGKGTEKVNVTFGII